MPEITPYHFESTDAEPNAQPTIKDEIKDLLRGIVKSPLYFGKMWKKHRAPRETRDESTEPKWAQEEHTAYRLKDSIVNPARDVILASLAIGAVALCCGATAFVPVVGSGLNELGRKIQSGWSQARGESGGDANNQEKTKLNIDGASLIAAGDFSPKVFSGHVNVNAKALSGGEPVSLGVLETTRGMVSAIEQLTEGEKGIGYLAGQVSASGGLSEAQKEDAVLLLTQVDSNDGKMSALEFVRSRNGAVSFNDALDFLKTQRGWRSDEINHLSCLRGGGEKCVLRPLNELKIKR